jgi:C4-dicarboxylate transporter DctM subunit
MSGLLLVILVLGLVFLRQPLFVIVGSTVAYCYAVFGDGLLEGMIEDVYFAAAKEILLAIPLFILAGQLMTQGAMAARLIRVARALTAPVPAGLAVSGVVACALFAAISGSSPVTLIAVGSMMYPALKKEGYPKTLSVGLLSAAGTLGIIIPPSIPMIIFAIMAGVSVTQLFIAGIGPGLLLMSLMVAYALFRTGFNSAERGKWDSTEIAAALKEGIFSLLMPAMILGGIYSGFFTATESAAMAVLYALVVELVIHRELKPSGLFDVFEETARTIGGLFLILLLAVSLNKFLTFQEVPQSLVTLMKGVVTSQWAFLLGVNVLLLLVGCVMDIMSAILVLAPLLTPVAIEFGVNPIHFGIIMIVNLEIGYLTPPVGINLFVASGVFKEDISVVIKSVLPLMLVLLVGLLIITFWPGLSLGLL